MGFGERYTYAIWSRVDHCGRKSALHRVLQLAAGRPRRGRTRYGVGERAGARIEASDSDCCYLVLAGDIEKQIAAYDPVVEWVEFVS